MAVLAVSDPCVVSQKTNGCLLVVRPSNDSKYQAKEATDRLRSVGAKLLGCVINTFGSTKEFAQASGYYGNYSDYDKAYRKAQKNNNGVEAANGVVAPRLQTADVAAEITAGADA